MSTIENRFLFLAGLASMGIALLHLVFIVVGTEAYRYFNAGGAMVRMSEAGSPVPALITLGVTVVFAGFGLYALAGTGLIKPLPFLKPVLVIIGATYTLRGLAAFYVLYLLATQPAPDSVRMLVFSLVSLAVGICYLAGCSVGARRQV